MVGLTSDVTDAAPSAGVEPPSPRRRALRWAWGLLRVVLLVGFVGGLVSIVDWSKLAEIASALSPWTIAAILLCGSAARAVGVLRWWTLLGGLAPDRRPPILHLLRFGLLAEFVNIWVPSFIGGEVVRVWGVRQHTPTSVAVWSVGIDRVLGLLGLVLAVLPLGLLVDLPLPPELWMAGVAALVVALGVAFLLRPRIAGLGGWAAALATLHPPRVLLALGLSSLSPWCLVLGYILFFGTLQPELSVGGIAAFILLSRFGRAVPIQLFGVNSVEGTMWVLGEIVGIPREILALSLAMNITDKYVHSMAGGLLELALNGTELLGRVARGEVTD